MNHDYGKRYPLHPNALYPFVTDPINFIALYRKMQSFGVTLKFDSNIFVFNEIVQAILVAS